MKLLNFMQSHQMTDEKMAEKIGVTRIAVYMYKVGQRIPRKEIMKKIRDVSDGKVQPNDFY
jgi:DNA-binding XRE family transcriptional regulator